MDYWQIKERIAQGEIEPVYLFVGDEDYLAEDLTNRLLRGVLEPGSEDFNLNIFYASEAEVGDIINAACAYPMMAERRVVIVKELHKILPGKLAALLTYLKNPLLTTCLILIAEQLDFRLSATKKLRDAAVYVPLKRLYENRVNQWLRNYLKEGEYTISEEALQLLQASVGTSLRAIVNEVGKIQLNIDPRREIEEDDVAHSVGISRQFSVFELCDAVGRKDALSSLKILSHMMNAGESAPGLVSMLTRHFRLLLKTKELLGRGVAESSISKEIGVNYHFINRYIQQSKNYDMRRFNSIFELLLATDIALKSSAQNPRLLLEVLLLQILHGEDTVARKQSI